MHEAEKALKYNERYLIDIWLLHDRGRSFFSVTLSHSSCHLNMPTWTIYLYRVEGFALQLPGGQALNLGRLGDEPGTTDIPVRFPFSHKSRLKTRPTSYYNP